MKKVYIKTLGCDKNTVDSEGIMGLLESAGYSITKKPKKADVLIVNTCGFIEDAKKQSIEAIFDLIREKEDRKLIVTGCLSQRYANDLVKDIPEVDAFVGVDNNKDLVDIIESVSDDKVFVDNCSTTYIELPRKIKKSHTAAIKIAEGCPNKCSYCAIPLMKGKYRSRKEKDILKEAKKLAKAGTKELLIIAQDVTFYGRDRKEKNALPKLLHKLCKIKGIKWIRLLYCYENEITDELIQCIKDEDKICKYIDIPIQHCNTELLKAMNRKSTHESILRTVKKLRKEIPEICIRTTLIVGFPGESKKAFDELLDFVEEVKFDRLGAFTYSKEEDTKAFSMSGQVRNDIKEQRLDQLMELQREISLEHNKQLIGKTVKVLVEAKEDNDIYLGRTYMDAPEIDNCVMFTSKKKIKIGSFVKVYIKDAFDYDITGDLA